MKTPKSLEKYKKVNYNDIYWDKVVIIIWQLKKIEK